MSVLAQWRLWAALRSHDIVGHGDDVEFDLQPEKYHDDDLSSGHIDDKNDDDDINGDEYATRPAAKNRIWRNFPCWNLRVNAVIAIEGYREISRTEPGINRSG